MANQALLGPLIDDLIRRESDPGELHVFRYCNGEVRVSIRIYTSDPIHLAGKLVKSSWDKYLGTGANCRNCKATLFIQYGAEVLPAWAKESAY